MIIQLQKHLKNRMKMKNIEVREFEKITTHNVAHLNGIHTIPGKAFNELSAFITDYQKTNGIDEQTLFFKIGYDRQAGNYIQARNYVGLIQLRSGYQIQILPKIDLSGDTDPSNKEMKVFLRMLRCLKELSFKAHSAADLHVTNTNLYEIFIRMFIDETHELVRHYLKSNYVNEEDNLNVFKGKLLINEHIKKNLVHKECFYVSYDDYNLNRPENKLIKSTLLKLQRISTDYSNVRDIRQLLMSFEVIDESTNFVKDFAGVTQHDRSMSFYENLMLWSRVFLLGKSFTSFSGSTNAISLLFPMEKVFESYVAKLIKKNCFASIPNLDVTAQDKGYYLYDEPNKKFTLRPDIVIRSTTQNEKKPIAILDTKWKRLNNNPSINYGISQADMYQVYAYAKKYDCNDLWLLYPQTDEMKNGIISPFISKDGVQVSVFFIDLENAENPIFEGSIAKLITAINLLQIHEK